MGISAKKQIEANECFLTVPNILIVSVANALNDAALVDFFKDNGKVFGKKHPDHEFLILASFLTYHTLRGEDSFWYPYLQVMNVSDLPSSWPDEDIAQFKDIELVESCILYRAELETEWTQMSPIFEKFPDLFSGTTKDLFLKMYNFVCTRCFGWGLPCVMMVPMVDYLNHMPVDTTIGLFNLKHTQSDQNKTDFSLLFKKEFLDDVDPATEVKIKGVRPLAKYSR